MPFYFINLLPTSLLYISILLPWDRRISLWMEAQERDEATEEEVKGWKGGGGGRRGRGE